MGNFKGQITLFAKGILMGIADAIPGISGATVALLTGIYTKLLNVINDYTSLAFIKQNKWNLAFVLTLGLGVLIGLLVTSHAITYLLTHARAITFSILFGLVLGATTKLYTKSIMKMQDLLYLLFVPAITLIILQINIAIPTTALGLFAGGILGGAAMILPGISGSYVLLIVGQYAYVLELLKSYNPTIIFTAIGAFVGIVTFAKATKVLFKIRQSRLVLLAFVLGSLPVLILEAGNIFWYHSLIGIVAIAVGYTIQR